MVTVTLEEFDNPDNYHVRQTACPYCDEPLDPQVGFATHWPDCPANPEAAQ